MADEDPFGSFENGEDGGGGMAQHDDPFRADNEEDAFGGSHGFEDDGEGAGLDDDFEAGFENLQAEPEAGSNFDDFADGEGGALEGLGAVSDAPSMDSGAMEAGDGTLSADNGSLGGDVNGLGVGGTPSGASEVPAPTAEGSDEDDGALRTFERKWRAMLEEKDAQFAEKRESLREAARKELAQFKDEKAAGAASKAKANRESESVFMQSIDDALTAANPWERIATLVDVNAQARDGDDEPDVSRLRSLLIQLKSTPMELQG